MPASALQNLGLLAGWDLGEEPWGDQMNANLRQADLLIQAHVKDKDLTAPPAAVAGDAYIVGAAPTGAWATHAMHIARYTGSAWEFYTPQEGWHVWADDENLFYTFDGSTWSSTSVTATDVSVTDAGNYYAGTNVETILQEIGALLNGTARVPALRYVIETVDTTDSDPGPGLLKFDNATPATATFLYFDDSTNDGVDLSTYFAALGAAGFVKIQSALDAGEWAIFKINGALIDGTGYWKVPVLIQASKGTLDDADEVLVQIDVSDGSGMGGTELKGLTFISDTTSQTDSDPGAGKMRWNNSIQASATKLFFDNTTLDSVTMTTFFSGLTGGTVYLQQSDDATKWQLWSITTPVADSGYYDMTVSLLASAGEIADVKTVLCDFKSGGSGSAFTGGTLTSALNEAPAVTIASSATPAIFAAAGNTINLTGTTTVTGFDTIAAGAVRRVIFGGILQLTYNATSMQNITSANITTAAGDVAEFESLGAGNTKMLSYQRADGTPLVGGGTPAGSTNQVQYNNAGAFGAEAGFEYDASTNTLAVEKITATGLVSTPASSTSSAGLRVAHGAAPTTPTNGDIWTTTAGIYVRINGVTVGPLGAAGGGAGTKTYATLTPMTSQPPATGYATLDTRNSIAVLKCPPSVDSGAYWDLIMPEGAALGSGLKIRVHTLSDGTSGNARLLVKIEADGTDADSDSFDADAQANATANATSGIPTVTEITLTTIDSLAAGGGYRLYVGRKGTDATNDTMTSFNLQIRKVEVRSAA